MPLDADAVIRIVYGDVVVGRQEADDFGDWRYDRHTLTASSKFYQEFAHANSANPGLGVH